MIEYKHYANTMIYNLKQSLASYVFVCDLLKEKFTEKMHHTSSFPLLFFKVYRDWVRENQGYRLVSVDRPKLKELRNPDSTILISPISNFTIYDHSVPKREDGTFYVNLCCVESSIKVKLLAKHEEYVKPKEILTSNACTATILDRISPNVAKSVHESKSLTFFLEPTEYQNAALAQEVGIQLYRTHELTKLNSDQISSALRAWFKKTRYVLNKQIIVIDTGALVMEEFLDIHSNVKLTVKVTLLDDQGENKSLVAGQLISEDTKVQELGNIVDELLPRELDLVPAHSLSIFNKLSIILRRNLERSKERINYLYNVN